MSSEVWALVGVVVGSVLGALAQIVADRLRRRNDNRILLHQERRAAYIEFMATYSRAVGKISLFSPYGDEADPGAVRRAADRIITAMAAVTLCAPEDTLEAAQAIQRLLFEAVSGQSDPVTDDLVKSVASFQIAAQRDLRL